MEIFYLPAYAPEHNPDEYLNNDLKQTIKNKPRAKTRNDLVVATSSILKSIQKRPDRVKSYFHAKHVALRCLMCHLFHWDISSFFEHGSRRLKLKEPKLIPFHPKEHAWQSVIFGMLAL